MCMCTLSHVRLFVTPWTIACKTPLSMGFSGQESWSSLPFPSPSDLPYSGIEPISLVSKALQVGSLPAEPPEKPLNGSQVKEVVTHTQHTHTHTHTYTHTRECYLSMRKKGILPFVTTQMELEVFIISEISQTEKHKCCMVSLIYVI